MKIFTSALFSIAIVSLLSCKSDQSVLKAENGHNLWFHSLAQYGEPSSSEMTTKDILNNELDLFWKGDQKILLDYSETCNISLGSEGFILRFSKSEIKIEANTRIPLLYL